MSWFSISDRADEELRIKSFSGASKNGKHTVHIDIETTDIFQFYAALKELEEIQKVQKAPRAVPKKAAAKPLGIPAPQLALPAPEDEA